MAVKAEEDSAVDSTALVVAAVEDVVVQREEGLVVEDVVMVEAAIEQLNKTFVRLSSNVILMRHSRHNLSDLCACLLCYLLC